MKKNKTIASIYPFPFFIGEGHDVNFSLVNGNKIFSNEEGKINQIVHNNLDKFPQKSMLSGLKENKIQPKDITDWVFGGKGTVQEKQALKYFFNKFKAKDYKVLKRNKKIHYVNHHLAHASLGVWGCGLKEGTFISLDDGGDESYPYDTVWGKFKGNNIKTFQKANKFGWGITRFHNLICESVGYLGNVDNGKVMGLAAYGKVNDELYNKLKKYLVLSNDGFSAKCLFRRNKTQSNYNYAKLKIDSFQQYKIIHQPNPPEELKRITKFFSNLDVAATGQKLVEDITVQTIKNILNKTKSKNLVCSGGFFQNVSLNKRLLDLNLKKVYVPSAPNDAGLSLGAAMYVHMKKFKTKRPSKEMSPFLGLSYNNHEIEELLKEYKLKYRKTKKPWLTCAKLLTKGKIIGWFQGKSELGPRSLGARSVLADPRKKINKAKVNQLLKKRDWFMPYAPSVLEEKLNFFVKEKISCPYMSFAIKVSKNAKLIPAAIHVDNSCRPQSVNKNTNFKFYNLIKEFYKITGVPAVLNTSFNRHGIATIATPRQAIDHLFNGCIDILIIEDFIVFPRKNKVTNSKNLLSEKYYIFIEKFLHILLAAREKDKDIKKILHKSKFFLKSKNVKFNKNFSYFKIGNKSFKIDFKNRTDLYKKIMPKYNYIVNE